MDNLTKSQRWFKNHKEQQRAYVRRRRKELHDWYLSLKATKKCNLCPEDDPACLEFHHKNSEEKEINLSYCYNKGWSKERILREMAKCEVLCSNCHRKLHWKLNHVPVV
jgi:hypothetical protein